MWFYHPDLLCLLFLTVSSDFIYFHSFTSKYCLKVSHFCKNVNCAKVVNFETIFRGEGIELEKIWWHGWKEEILKFQNVKSDFLYLLPFSHKLTWKLANFRKFKCCRERNLDYFHFLQFWYLTTSFGKDNYIFRKKKEFCFCDFLISFMSFSSFLTENVDPISPILKFLWKLK